MTKRNPVQFDPQRRAARADLKATIETFARHLESEEVPLEIRSRARRDLAQRNFRLAVESIACNLLVAATVAPDATLSVPRSHAAMWSRGRYHTPVYGQHFLDILDLLAKLKLVSEITKGYRYSRTASQPTTVRATQTLTRHLPLGMTGWADFCREQEQELIVLKPAKDDTGSAHPIDYKDTARTAKWRREVRAINAWLAAAPIAIIENGHRTIYLDNGGQPIEPYRRTLRRIFNNDDWNAGGRLFGGFWMTMERPQRFELIRIAGEEVANVDYSSLFPRLAYARARVEQPDGDLYDVLGDGACRDGWKALINAMLFAMKPLGGWPTDAREELPQGMKLRDAVQAIKRKHAPIAKLFERGLGFQLMRHESDLLVSVVTALFKDGVTALPLHDSVLVAQSHAAMAKGFMEQEFKHRTGAARAFVKIDFGPI
jgi:hypothetical protein